MSNCAKLEQILKRIADQYHTTPQNVRQDLQEVIDTGWENPDPVIHARWQMIGRGKKPSVQELVFFSADVVNSL